MRNRPILDSSGIIRHSVKAAPPAACLAQCPTPPQYTNSTSRTAGNLLIVMALDRAQCAVGESVNFYLEVAVEPSSWSLIKARIYQ